MESNIKDIISCRIEAEMVSYFPGYKGIRIFPCFLCMGPVRGGIQRGLRGPAPLIVDSVVRPPPSTTPTLCAAGVEQIYCGWPLNKGSVLCHNMTRMGCSNFHTMGFNEQPLMQTQLLLSYFVLKNRD